MEFRVRERLEQIGLYTFPGISREGPTIDRKTKREDWSPCIHGNEEEGACISGDEMLRVWLWLVPGWRGRGRGIEPFPGDKTGLLVG